MKTRISNIFILLTIVLYPPAKATTTTVAT